MCPRGKVLAEGASMGPVHHASSRVWWKATGADAWAEARQSAIASATTIPQINVRTIISSGGSHETVFDVLREKLCSRKLPSNCQPPQCFSYCSKMKLSVIPAM